MINGNCFPPPINQSTSVSGSSILPESSSDLDTDQGVIIHETIKQVAQSVNQTILKTSTSNPISNLTQNHPPHDRVTNRQSSHDPKPSDGHTQTNTQPIQTYRAVSPKNSITHPDTNFDQAKQIITDIDTLSHFLTLIVKQSTCYPITPDTHQWYRINANEITDNHKIALCNTPTVHMVPLPLAEPSEINSVETIARLTHSQTSKDPLTIPTHSLFTVIQPQLTITQTFHLKTMLY